MIEQEITRLVNQSEKKGRFIIQELDDDNNNFDKCENFPVNNVEKFFSKKTKHSSICNHNNKIIHLLHNQSENPDLNINFSTFIFDDNSKNWVDFDIIWRKFSQFHNDVSENNMEKIFNYTDLKSDVEDDENKNTSYFNDSLTINNQIEEDVVDHKLILSNEILKLENGNKNIVNPSNDNLTIVQTTDDFSHSNIADTGILSNLTSTQYKNMNSEINFNSNCNNNGNNICNIQIINNNQNHNYNFFCQNTQITNNNNILNNIISNKDTNINLEGNILHSNSKNNFKVKIQDLNKEENTDAKNGDICFKSLSSYNFDENNRCEKLEIADNEKCEKIKSDPDQLKLNLLSSARTILKNKNNINPTKAYNCEGAKDNNTIIKTPQFIDLVSKIKIDKDFNNLNSNTLILEENLSCGDANKNCELESNIIELSKIQKLNTNVVIEKNLNLNKNKAQNVDLESLYANNNINNNNIILQKEKTTSSPKIKNLEINFCEKSIINSPAFSPINSDCCHKFDKLNLNLNSPNKNFKLSEKSKLKSSDRLFHLEEYFKEENINCNKRQKRIFSVFKPSRNHENFYPGNFKISNQVNLCFISENKKNEKLNDNQKNISSKKKFISKNKRHVNLLISKNLDVEITSSLNIDENHKKNQCKEDREIKGIGDTMQDKVFGINKSDYSNKEYICCSCGTKNFIVD